MKKTLFILMAALPLIFVSCDGKQNTDNPGTDVPGGETPGGETPGGSESPDKSSSLGINALDLGLSVEWADKNLGAKEATAPVIILPGEKPSPRTFSSGKPISSEPSRKALTSTTHPTG